MNKISGIVLLVLGGLLVLWGYNASQSLESHMMRLYSGEPDQSTFFYYIGGGLCLLLGIVNLLRR